MVTPAELKSCYCTLLTSESYVVGVQALILSLLNQSVEGSPDNRDILVQHTDTISKFSLKAIKKLHSERVQLRLVDKIQGPNHPSRTVENWSDYTKLRIWELTDYEKILYLDADMLVLEPLDHLFAQNLGDLGFAAAPDVYPPDRFNAGLILLHPSLELFQKLLDKVPTLTSYDGGDTGFLNAFFPTWYKAPQGNRLSFAYNAQRTLYWMTHKSQPGYWDAVGPIKVLHYSSYPKPWVDPSRKGDLEMLWWTTYTRLLEKNKVTALQLGNSTTTHT